MLYQENSEGMKPEGRYRAVSVQQPEVATKLTNTLDRFSNQEEGNRLHMRGGQSGEVVTL